MHLRVNSVGKMSSSVTHPFAPIVTTAKIFGLLSAKSPSRTNWGLILYSIVLVVIYLTILILRFIETQKKDFAVNKVVTYLHVVCYVMVFSANILSNWTNSKIFLRDLIRLEIFDCRLKNSVQINYKKMRKVFFKSLSLSLVIFLLVATTDFVGEVILTNLTFITWFSFYLPFIFNYFAVFIIIFKLFLINERFKWLKLILIKIIKNESVIDLKEFTNLFLELIEILNSITANFSLQIGSTFLMVFVIVTTNLYLLLKVVLTPIRIVLNINFFVVHLVEIILIVFVFFWTNNKIREIVTLSPRILSVNGKTKITQKEVIKES